MNKKLAVKVTIESLITGNDQWYSTFVFTEEQLKEEKYIYELSKIKVEEFVKKIKSKVTL